MNRDLLAFTIHLVASFAAVIVFAAFVIKIVEG